MPFLDAMKTGWIIPLAATVRLDIRDEGRLVEAGRDFDRTMVSNHGVPPVAAAPGGGRPTRKNHNSWTIVTPPGWSVLVTHPLNRPNGLVEIPAGVADTDTYAAPIHFPFFATGPDGLHVIEKGSPVAQVIPFRRDGVPCVTPCSATCRPRPAGTGPPPGHPDRTAAVRRSRSPAGFVRSSSSPDRKRRRNPETPSPTSSAFAGAERASVAIRLAAAFLPVDFIVMSLDPAGHPLAGTVKDAC